MKRNNAGPKIMMISKFELGKYWNEKKIDNDVFDDKVKWRKEKKSLLK